MRAISLLALALGLVLAPAELRAEEVDQFTDRLFQLAHLHDASAAVDERVNAMLRGIEARLDRERPRSREQRDQIVYEALQGGRFELVAELSTPFEYWLRDHADVELFRVDRRGMYGGAVDYDDMGLGWYVELAPVIRIGPLLVGIDKLGHFLGQGWFYYREAQRLHAAYPRASEAELHERLLAYGHGLESSFLGLAGTGIYSYADLAANWQGFVFYRELFDGPHPYFASSGDGQYRLVRTFHILDYATDAWDEVENPSRPRNDRFYGVLARYLRAHVCAAYRAAPAQFMNATGRAEAAADYVWSGAGDAAFACTHRLALDEICGPPLTPAVASSPAPPAAGAPRSTARPEAR